MKTTLVALVLAATACGTLKVDPVTVQPIHITVDVNVHDHRGPAGPSAVPSKP